VSLSTDPAFTALKESFVCGYRDISDQPYAGVSGLHKPDGNAINTTNGAGPHNLQLFILSPEGVVLTCLPGYWNAYDLVHEMQLAEKLNEVWHNPMLGRAEKDAIFRQMHQNHVQEHSNAMVFRSRMQGFDQKWEAKHKLTSSDCIRNACLITDPNAKMLPQDAFKTTDEIMHQRMALRPFRTYDQFDVAAYTDYGRPIYDKHEDYRDATGRLLPGADPKSAPKIGNVQGMRRQFRQARMQNQNRWNGVRYYGARMGGRMMQNGMQAAYEQ